MKYRKIPITRKKFLRRKRYIDALIEMLDMQKVQEKFDETFVIKFRELRGRLNERDYNELWQLLKNPTHKKIFQMAEKILGRLKI